MKKRLFSYLLAAALLLTLVPVGVRAADILYGDVNGDGNINAKDATLILRYSVGKLTEDQKFDEVAANVNADEGVNAKDATLILRYSVHKLDKFPADTHEHSYEAVVTYPTCTEDGYTTYTCSCGDSYMGDETDALGHDWSQWWSIVNVATGESYYERDCQREGCDESERCYHSYKTEAVAPTTEAKGYDLHTCSVCGHSYKDNYKDKLPVDIHEHDYTSEVKGSTCTKAGYTRYICPCGYIYRDDYTEALGHEWNDWVEAEVPTTSAKGELSRTCSVCGKTEYYYDSRHYLYSEMIYDENGKAVGWDITCRWRDSNGVMCDYHKVIEMEGNEEFCGFSYNGQHHKSWTTVYDENGEAIGKEAKCRNGSKDGGKCDYYDFVAFNKMPENFDPSICGEHTRKDYWYNFDWECMSELSIGTCRDCGYVFILDGSDASISVEALEYLNERRAEYGLPALEGVSENEKITTHMKLRAEELAYVVPLTARSAHKRPDGTQGAGPCVAGGYGPQSVIDAWLESNSHNGWLLSEDATVAIITNVGSFWIYWTDGGLPN